MAITTKAPVPKASNWVWAATIGAVVVALIAMWVGGVFDITPVVPAQ
jgi:hypothetical protein